MKADHLWQKRIVMLGLVLLMGASMSACAGVFGHSKEWKEEVKLHDGRVIVVERVFSLGGYPGLEARERSPLDQTITFALPGTNKRISWATEYRDDKPEANSLGPLLLDVVDGIPYLVTSPAGCIAYNKWGRPNPPYILFKFLDDQWQQIPLQELPPQLIEANLIGLPASSQLKSYYTVEAASAERNRGNVSAYTKTILREAIPSVWSGCGEMIRKGNGGWDGIGWFSDQPSKEACLKYCERNEVSAQDCPCNRLFKGK